MEHRKSLKAEVSQQVTHTPKDAPDIVDPAKVAQIAVALRVLIER